MPAHEESDGDGQASRVGETAARPSDRLRDLVVASRAKPLAFRIGLALAFTLVALLFRSTLFSDLGDRPTYVPFHAAVILAAAFTGPAGCAVAALLSIVLVHAAFVPFTAANDAAIVATFLTTAALLTGLIELLISTRQRMLDSERMRLRDEDLRRFIDQAPVAIAMFDRDMRYVAVSRRWITDYQIATPDILGRSHYEVFPTLPETLKAVHRRALAGEAIAGEEEEFLLSNGSIRWERWEVLPWRHDNGAVGGITIFTENITERCLAERQLRENKADLKRAQTVARVASWRMTFADNRLKGADQIFELLGYPPDAILDYDTLLAIVHEEDRERVNAARRSTRDGQSYDIECRYFIGGKIRWMRERSEPDYSPDGTIVGGFGVIQDISDRKGVELDLTASEERLRLALEAAGMAVWAWDIRSGVDVWNDQSYRMIGYEPGEVTPGFETWQRHIHPDDREIITERYLKSIEEGTDISNEHRIIDRFGKVKWVSVRGRVVRDQMSRPIRSFGVITDVTERKEAEERDRILTAEVNHRAKNLLAVVQAVAIQTARQCEPETFVTAFNERLGSLAASHDLLVYSQWRGVDITELIRSQLSHFTGLIGSRITLDGGPAELTATSAQTIGLALHELVTNATKYGALSEPAGEIGISWTIEDRGGEPHFRVTWQETGGPPVTPPDRRGFGHGVLVKMAEYSLGATVDLTYPETGIVWTLDAPAKLVLQPSAHIA